MSNHNASQRAGSADQKTRRPQKIRGKIAPLTSVIFRKVQSLTQARKSSRSRPMRSAFDPQLRLDCPGVPDVRLNTDGRDEIIPILRALQHIYGRPELRDELLDAVAHDVNGITRADQGRPGMAYWSILVLGAVRLGCNLNYDRLQNLAEEHRSLRRIMGI